VRRAGQRTVPRTPEELERLLPLREQDRLGLAARIPTGHKVSLFTLTLTHPGARVRRLPLKAAADGGTVRLDGLVPLEQSPATEFFFVCGSPRQAPGEKEVADLLAGFTRDGRAVLGSDVRLPAEVVLSFGPDRVEVPRFLIGAVERDPLQRVADVLDGVRARLRKKYPFVAGLAFTHVPGDEARALGRGGDPAVPSTAGWGSSSAQRTLFKEVLERLLATDRVRKNYPAEYVWPPRVYIQPHSAKIDNAFAGVYDRDRATGKWRVRAVITEGYLNKVVQEDPDRLAAVMGHELAHVTRRHIRNVIVRDLAGLSLSRDQEIEADLEGAQIAVAAGYSYRRGVRAAVRAFQLYGYSNFEGVRSTHPAWVERLALLDREQAKLWRAMAAFQNGHFFLHAEQYEAAERCFAHVVEEFPDCAEAWANLGYARLMQYCDELDTQDLRGYGIAQFAAGGFYARPEGMGGLRGDGRKWHQAVRALETALLRDGKVVLARANLGLAYLVHPDGKAHAAEALEYFRAAAKDGGKGLTGLSEAAFLVNYGVAELAAGRREEAAARWRLARKALPPQGPALRGQLLWALLYNEAALDAAGDRDARARALRGLEEYLGLASPDSTWWALAHEQYLKLAGELGVTPLTRQQLANRLGGRPLRVVASVELAPGKLLTVGDRAAAALKLLGQGAGAGVPVYPRARARRYVGVAPDVDLLADHLVLAIFLTGDKAPPVTVQARGPGAARRQLRVGMSLRELREALKDQAPADGDGYYVVDPGVRYVFWPALGLGVRLDEDRVVEIAVTQVARQSAAEPGRATP
jgi:tetratricopeptide (TPR) repeat protein